MNCETHACFHDMEAGIRRERICRFLIAERQLVDRLLGKTLCPNPYWDSLLELYLAEFEGRTVYQSCLAPGAPPANAHRQSAQLAKLGAVTRTLDPDDHRRMNVRLTPETRIALDGIMDGLAPRADSVNEADLG